MRGYHVQAWLTRCWNRQQSSQATQFKVDGSWLAVEFIYIYIYINSFVGNCRKFRLKCGLELAILACGSRHASLATSQRLFWESKIFFLLVKASVLRSLRYKTHPPCRLWSKSTKILCDGGGACQQWKSAALQQESKWEGEYPTDSYKSYSIWVLFHLFDPIWSIGSMRRKTQRPMCPGLRRKGGVANSAPKAGRMTCARCSWWVSPPKMCAFNPKKVGTRQPFF